MFIIILFFSIKFVEDRQGRSFFSPHIVISLSSFFFFLPYQCRGQIIVEEMAMKYSFHTCLWETEILCKLLYSDFQLRLWMTGIFLQVVN